MVNKKAVFIATIVAVLVIGVIFAFNVNKLDKENSNIEENTNASSNINVNKNETETNKTVENNVNDENTTNTTAEANTVKEENTNTNNSTENTNTSSNQKDKAEEYEVSAEGAIKLLKTKIKQRSNTYFYTEDEVSEGVYIISLRDETTTAEIASYKVDVKNKTVTEN